MSETLLIPESVCDEKFDAGKLFQFHYYVNSFRAIPAARKIMKEQTHIEHWDLKHLLEYVSRGVNLVELIQMIDVARELNDDGPHIFRRLIAMKTSTFLYAAEYLLRCRQEVCWTFQQFQTLWEIYIGKGYVNSINRMTKLITERFSPCVFNRENVNLTDLYVRMCALDAFLPKKPVDQPMIEAKKRGPRPKSITLAPSAKRPRLDEHKIEEELYDEVESTGSHKGTKPIHVLKMKIIWEPTVYEFNDEYKLRGATGLTKYMNQHFYLKCVKPLSRLTFESLKALETSKWHMKKYTLPEVAVHILLYGHDGGGQIVQGRWWYKVWDKAEMDKLMERPPGIYNSWKSPCEYMKNTELQFNHVKAVPKKSLMASNWDEYKNEALQIGNIKGTRRNIFEGCRRFQKKIVNSEK